MVASTMCSESGLCRHDRIAGLSCLSTCPSRVGALNLRSRMRAEAVAIDGQARLLRAMRQSVSVSAVRREAALFQRFVVCTCSLVRAGRISSIAIDALQLGIVLRLVIATRLRRGLGFATFAFLARSRRPLARWIR